MMRSLSSAVAGLRSHQTKMDVIGNNIANVNTYGFKSSRATFSDVYYQTLTGAASPGTASGGTNPTQIGYGAAVATIDVLNTQSGRASTDRALDVYIAGEGFLVTQDASGTFLYTRLGNLGFDAEGNLIDSNGNFVLGFPQNTDGSAQIPANGIAQGDALQPIKVNPELLDQLTGISISTGGEIVGVLPGGAKVSIGSAVPDFIIQGTESIGEDSTLSGSIKMNMGGYFEDVGITATDGTPAFDITDVLFGDVAIDAGQNVSFTVKNGIVTMEAIRTVEGKEVPVKATGTLKDGNIVLKDGDGNIVFTLVTNQGANTKAKLTDTPDGTPITVAALLRCQLTATDKGGNVVKTDVLDPTTLTDGILKLEDFQIKLDTTKLGATNTFAGVIGRAGLEESSKLNIGCIALAKFRNAAALEQGGTSNFMATSNSGEAIFVKPGIEGTGSLVANSLEMSNVDISKEFTDMITTQRGFQANTRIVTVSDEMLQELVNLKR